MNIDIRLNPGKKSAEIIAGKFDRIDNYIGHSHKRFHATHIHDFRLEIKKLLAFLDLMTINGAVTDLPKPLKKIYHRLGDIRLIQLQQEKIIETAVKLNLRYPIHYLASLEFEKVRVENKTAKIFDHQGCLKVREVAKRLPKIVSEEMSHAYLSKMKQSLNGLLTGPVAEGKPLHEVRKLIKRILYNLPLFTGGNKQTFNFDDKMSRSLKKLEENIGAYRDVTLAIEMLDREIKDPQEIWNTKILDSIKQDWENERFVLNCLISHAWLKIAREKILKTDETVIADHKKEILKPSGE